MSVTHIHSVQLENGNFHHLFNLMFMTVDEVFILQQVLDGKPVPVERVDSLNNLKAGIQDIISKAKAREAQENILKPSLVADDDVEEVEGEVVNEDDDNVETEDEAKEAE